MSISKYHLIGDQKAEDRVRVAGEGNKAANDIRNDGAQVDQQELKAQRFRETINRQLDVLMDDAQGADEKISSLMSIGLDYLKLDAAMLGMVTGNHLSIIALRGVDYKGIAVGNTVNIKETVCHNILDSENVVAIKDTKAAKQALTDKVFPDLPINSFIGASVQTATGPYGLICFSSLSARSEEFDPNDCDMASLVASWIGTVIGHKEQIEFIENLNDYYQALFRTVPAMTILANEDGLILSTSDRLCKKLNIDPLTVPGRYCHELFAVHDKEKLSQALTMGEANHMPLTLLCADKSTLDVELNSSIKTVGTFHGIRMIVLADVSERNRALAELEEQNKRLAFANESLNQFAYVASHDLQEPLRKIQQFAGFLKEDLEEDEMSDDTAYHLQVVTDSAYRMSTLVRDLLKLAGASNSEVQLSELAMGPVITEVKDELELRISESGATVSTENLPTVVGEASLLRQLFTNLVSNSIKYSSKERKPHIHIAGYSDDNGKEGIIISDNGIGFDMKHANQIFEPFNRLHRNGEYHGNGIGLSICAAVCKKHNWKLSAESEPGVGSKFRLEFKK